MRLGKVPSRRAVMTAFGRYLDWMEWANEVKRGEEELPDDFTLGDMLRSGMRMEGEYQRLASAFISKEEPKDPSL